jgi:membrane protease YdiL (CAAX protease family)
MPDASWGLLPYDGGIAYQAKTHDARHHRARRYERVRVCHNLGEYARRGRQSEKEARMNRESSQVQVRQVWVFFALTCAISWAIWLPLLLWPDRQDQLQFLIFCGAFGPWLAAAILTWQAEGRSGVWRWLRHIFNPGIHVVWYLVSIVVLPIGAGLLHYGLYLLLGGEADLSSAPSWFAFLPSLLATALLGGGNEEPGWRGYALPRLLERFHPLVASCIIAPFWTLWHLPLQLSGGWGKGESMLLMLVYVLPLSIIMTWLTLQSKGSVLPAMLFHGGGNVYSTWFPTETLWIGSTEIEFNAIKAVVYTLIALTVIVATRGRLGHRARVTGLAETHDLATAETC